MRVLLLALLSLNLLSSSHGRPSVRGIKDTRQFDQLIKKHKSETGLPVIVDFYSDGCGPCRQIAPVYKQVAKQYEGKAVFVKVNMNTQHQLAQRYSGEAAVKRGGGGGGGGGVGVDW